MPQATLKKENSHCRPESRKEWALSECQNTFSPVFLIVAIDAPDGVLAARVFEQTTEIAAAFLRTYAAPVCTSDECIVVKLSVLGTRATANPTPATICSSEGEASETGTRKCCHPVVA